MSSIISSKKFLYQNGEQLGFNFFGSPNKDKNSKTQEEFEQLVENVFASKKRCPNILETTKILKTIFQNIEEKILEVYVGKENDVTREVYYNDSKLNIYFYHQKITADNMLDMTLEYRNGKDIQFSFNPGKQNLKDISISELKETVGYETNILTKLQDVKPLQFREEDLELSKIYYTFFQEIPDFSQTAIQEKTKYMWICLKYIFGIEFNQKLNHLFENLSICVLSEEYPYFFSQEIERLSYFGYLDEEIRNRKMQVPSQKQIEIIGSEISEYINRSPNPVEALKKFVRAECLRRYESIQLQAIRERYNSKSLGIDIQMNKELVRKITRKIERNNSN